jgi:hypothetical protein
MAQWHLGWAALLLSTLLVAEITLEQIQLLVGRLLARRRLSIENDRPDAVPSVRPSRPLAHHASSS